MAVTGFLARRAAVLATLAGMLAPAGAQEVYTYTDGTSGDRQFALGYPVPQPVASLTPVDGFRDWENLHARHQALALAHDFVSGHRVGRTIKGTRIFAYTVSDPDDATADGFPEPAFQITGTAHAREWQSPEVVTGIIERLVERRRDGWLYEYLVDNTNLVVIPVLNIDGFRQTQDYPAQVIVGTNPGDPSHPRDGRMRRKNMRGADRDLLTLDDHLNGIDLNRNNPPFSPSPSVRASPNPESLVFHGNGQVTEPETRALQTATELAPADQLRLYTDFHSFAAAFFDRLSGNPRRDAIHSSLIGRAIRTLRATGTPYGRDPSGPGLGIGSTDEYFADVIEVPSWTLELEPRGNQGGRQYGGFGAEHDGFILPDSQIDRVRRHIADAYAMLFYAQAGPPSVAAVRVLDGSDNVVWAGEWRRSGPKQRRFVTTVEGTLLTDRDYRIWVAFDKPMRFRDETGAVANYPGMTEILIPSLELTGAGEPVDLATAEGRWLDQADGAGAPGYRRYRDDAFIAPLEIPAAAVSGGATEMTLAVVAVDLAGNTLDADPSTVVGWGGGHWVSYESSDGTSGDSGGRDATLRIPVAKQEPAVVSLSLDRERVVEGGRVTVSLERDRLDTDFTVGIRAERTTETPEPVTRELFRTTVGFQVDGQSVRDIAFTVPDDLAVRPPSAMDEVRVTAVIEGGAARMAAPDNRALAVEDNDAPGQRVASIFHPYAFPFGPEISPLPPGLNAGMRLADTLRDAQSVAVPVTINLAGGGAYLLREAEEGTGTGYPAITGEVTITGRDTLVARDSGRDEDGPPFRIFHVRPDATLRLEGLRLENGLLEGGMPGGAVLNEGELVTDRVIFAGNRAQAGGALANEGTAELTRSSFVDNASASGGGAIDNQGTLNLRGVTLSGNLADGRGGGVLNHADLDVRESTFADNAGRHGSDLFNLDSARVGASVLASNGSCVNGPEGVTTSDGYNMDADGTCGLTLATDRGPGDPLLEPLDDFGLRLPEPLSPLVAGIPAEGPECLASDARGVPRPFESPNASTGPPLVACEIGAAERGLNVARGMWYNPGRSGHGIDLQRARDLLLITWFTYGPDGNPVWYQALAPFTGDHWEADLFSFAFDHSENGAEGTIVGSVTLDFESETAATFGWNLSPIGGGIGSEPFEPLIFSEDDPVFDLTGHWAAADESNWGLTVDIQGAIQVATVYYYDAEGNPRWVQGVGSAGPDTAIGLDSFTGFCPGCDTQAFPVQATSVGELRLRYFTRRQGDIESDFEYPGAEGGRWQRQVGLGALTDPAP